MHSKVTLKMYGSEKRALLLMISTFCRCTIDIVDRVEARHTAARRVAWRPRGPSLPPRGHGVCQVRKDTVQDGDCGPLRTCLTHAAQPKYGGVSRFVRLGRAAWRGAWRPGATRRRAQSGREQAAFQVEPILAAGCQMQAVQTACDAGACVLLPGYVLDPNAACAYKKGLCAICGKQILDTSRYKQSN